MSSKTSLKGVFKGYVATLYSQKTGKLSLSDVFSQIGTPILLGSLSCVGVIVFPEIGSHIEKFFSNAMTVMSIISALTCDAALQLFSIRSEMNSEDIKNSSYKQGDLKLVDELFDDVLWAIVTGFMSVGTMALYGVFPNVGITNPLIAGLSIAVLLHSLQVSRMCIKRLYSVYHIVGKYWFKKK